MPSFHLLETNNTARLDGTYKEDLSGVHAWKGRKPKGMEYQPADLEQACHALRFSLISKLDGTKLNLKDSKCLPFEQGLTLGAARNTLEKMLLWKNGIGPAGIREIAKPLASLPRLYELNLSRNRLSDEGSHLLCRQLSLGVSAANLHTLWLSDNNIHTFPPDLLKLAGLCRLFLSVNQIKVVPSELGRLENLKHVDLDHNPTHGLPEDAYYVGSRRLPGPRWELLRGYLRRQLGLDLPEEDDDAKKSQRDRGLLTRVPSMVDKIPAE